MLDSIIFSRALYVIISFVPRPDDDLLMPDG